MQQPLSSGDGWPVWRVGAGLSGQTQAPGRAGLGASHGGHPSLDTDSDLAIGSIPQGPVRGLPHCHSNGTSRCSQ